MSEPWLDQAQSVRQAETLAVDKLVAYLKSAPLDLAGPLQVEQFPSGFSNLTYLLRFGPREVVLRRPPFGSAVKSAHDMGREYHILAHLAQIYDKVPRPLLYCADETVLGAPFYLMERVKGVILRAQLPPAMAPALMGRIAMAFIENLAELHALDYEAAGLAELGRPAGYAERQIKGWTNRYRQARTDEIPELERVAAWLADHLPARSGSALIHNDYKYDNLILDPADWSRILAVLDWEMSTLGDPLMDLGSSLGYWVEAGDPEVMHTLQFSPTTLPGNPSRVELVQRYAQASGRDMADIVFYYAYGLFKLAGIIQQIYYRYKMGYTQDSRFAELHRVVRACGLIAAQVIDKQRLERLF
jgi:aminoglycoside phosphotransferase (APT) family kinase protein